ncbi:MAG: N-acetylneuraminate synthase family protein [Saprospiraceae bacterium]|nr:N-acetylneuraminate synthase family protein [Saprospiraceae bacterium]
MITLKNGRKIGPGQPAYIIAEIGINHNGSMEIVKKLIKEAADAGCDAVKFQKRTPEICVPKDQWEIERDTPWGRITYIEYRHKMEFTFDEFSEIDAYCKELGIDWFASCWDEPSVDFLEAFQPPLYKVASASLTDHGLLRKKRATGRPVMISTGMSTLEEIQQAVEVLGVENLLIAHATSSYPCPLEELNLQMIQTLQQMYPDVPIGYSGHEVGLATTVAAVTLGASFVERHFTLDRAMWGSDQAASVEPVGMRRLVRDIRSVETALGDGVKKVYDSEIGPMQKLRRVRTQTVK